MSAIRCPALPVDTARAAESAFGTDHPYLKIGESLNDLLSGLDTVSLASADERLEDSFWPYSLATILQYWEDLTDHQMSNATRIRVDLKYALHLPLSFPGIDSLALCRFRQRLLLNPAGKEVFQQLVSRLADVVMNQDGLVGPKTEVSRTRAAVPSKRRIPSALWTFSSCERTRCPVRTEKPSVRRRVS